MDFDGEILRGSRKYNINNIIICCIKKEVFSNKIISFNRFNHNKNFLFNFI